MALVYLAAVESALAHRKPRQAGLRLAIILNKTETSRSSVQTYADAARITSTSMSSQSSSAARSATPEPVFCTVDTSRVPGDHIGDITPTMIRKTVEQEMR
jgi:hypothetical protein